MSKPKRGLGRGLGALIPSEPDEATQPDDGEQHGDAGPAGFRASEQGTAGATADRPRPRDVFFSSPSGDEQPDLVPVPGARFQQIDPHSVTPNPRQPRDVFDPEALAELVGSIKEIGVLQPIVVRPHPDGPGYELIMGERRLRASKEAGLELIPAIVRDTDDTDMLRDALVENLHRSQLNPLEEAAAYQQLLEDFGITHEQLAERISRSRPQISNTLRLLRLPAPVQKRVAAGVLSAGHARALLGLDDAADMEVLAQRIVAEGLSVRATEEAVTLGVGKPREKRGAVRAGGRTQALDDLGARLGDRFDTRVKVQLGRSRGKITIDFASVDDLNRIIAVLDPADPGVLQSGASS